MKNNWEKIKLGDVLSILTDYHANGSYEILKKNVTLLDEPNYAIMIRTTNFEKNDFRDDLKYIDKHAYEFLKKSKVYSGDILMNKIANAGSVYYMPNLSKPVSLAMNLFLLRTDSIKANQRFVYYYLKANELYIKQFAIGAAATTITKANVRNLEIMLPEISTQAKIDAILSNYDDLIENNTRRIHILEEMAQRIYREWFVHFRFPGHEHVKLVDSELGMIPEGWEVKKLGDVIELAYGKGLKKEDRIPGIIPVFGSGGIVGYHDEKLVNGPGIIVGRKGNVGSVFWSNTDFYPIDTVFFVKTNLNLYYVYFNLSHQNFINTDAAVPGLSRNLAYLNEFLLPDKEILDEFEKFIDNLYTLKYSLKEKNKNLRQTRDLLLPKLISGKIDVSDLDICTENLGE